MRRVFRMSRRNGIDMLMQALMGNQEPEGEFVGKITSGTVVKLNMADDAIDEVVRAHTDQLEERVQEFVKQAREELKLQPDFIAAKAARDAVWEDIYEELDIAKEQQEDNYSVNIRNRTVSRIPTVGNEEGLRCECGCGRLLTEEEVAAKEEHN
jgi:hypothetical protein